MHRTRSRAKAAREKSRSLSCSPSENATLLSVADEPTGRFQKPLLKDILEGVKEISIFVFHNVLNYSLMLSVMLFNGYIFVAVAMGAFIGYFLFGHLSMKINMENLQAIQTKIICSTRCADSGKSKNSLSNVLCRDILRFSYSNFISLPLGASCADNSGPCSNDTCNNHF